MPRDTTVMRTGRGVSMGYVKPEIVDYGNLVALTQAKAFIGDEDGASKFDTPDHHSVP
jgi:hypothetical protein